MRKKVTMRNLYGGNTRHVLPHSCWEDSEGVIIGGERIMSLHISPRRSTQKVRTVQTAEGELVYKCMTLDDFHDLWVELRKIHI